MNRRVVHIYQPLNYSNSMQQDSRLQSANILDLLVAVFPRKVVSSSLSPLLYHLGTSIITFFLVNPKIRMSLPKFDSPGWVLHGFTPFRICPISTTRARHLNYSMQISFIFLSPGDKTTKERFSRYLQNNSSLFLHLYCNRNCEPSDSVEVASHSIYGL